MVMATITFSVRVDDRTQRELAELTEHAESRNEAVNEAIHVAYRLLQQERMRQEALTLVNNPDDLADVKAVQEEIEDVRAW